MTICSEIVGTELKLTAAGKLRQLREFSREQDPASADVTMAAVMATARVVGIQPLICDPRSADDGPEPQVSPMVKPMSILPLTGGCTTIGRAQAEGVS